MVMAMAMATAMVMDAGDRGDASCWRSKRKLSECQSVRVSDSDSSLVEALRL